MAGTATVGKGLLTSPTAYEHGGGEIEIIDMENDSEASDWSQIIDQRRSIKFAPFHKLELKNELD